jgi:hypothetical protein
MHQQLWGYKVEWKSVSRGTRGKKVEYHWFRRPGLDYRQGQGFLSAPSRPDRFWGSSSLLSSEYRGLFPWGKLHGA